MITTEDSVTLQKHKFKYFLWLNTIYNNIRHKYRDFTQHGRIISVLYDKDFYDINEKHKKIDPDTYW